MPFTEPSDRGKHTVNDKLSSIIIDLAQRDRIAFKKHSALWRITSYLLGGYVENVRPLHVVVAVDNEAEMLWVITAYTPDTAEWEDGYTRRKRK